MIKVFRIFFEHNYLKRTHILNVCYFSFRYSNVVTENQFQVIQLLLNINYIIIIKNIYYYNLFNICFLYFLQLNRDILFHLHISWLPYHAIGISWRNFLQSQKMQFFSMFPWNRFYQNSKNLLFSANRLYPTIGQRPTYTIPLQFSLSVKTNWSSSSTNIAVHSCIRCIQPKFILTCHHTINSSFTDLNFV